MESSSSLERHIHISRQTRIEPAVAIVDPEPNLERFNIALSAADVALSGESRVYPSVKYCSGEGCSRRQADLKLVTEADAVDVGFLDVGPDPEVVGINQGDNGLPGVHHLSLERGAHRH